MTACLSFFYRTYYLSQVLVLWQALQSLLSLSPLLWSLGLPSAYVPLWQETQFEVIPEWLILAPEKLDVPLWQVSQGCDVGTWLAFLPVALDPLWQLAQPDETPEWLNLAPENELVLLWQVSQAAVVAL